MNRVKQRRLHRRVMDGHPLWRDLWCRSHFTLEEARRALPYVARILADASAAYHELQDARLELMLRIHPARRAELNTRREASLRRLDKAIDEFNAVGADLMDLAAGVVRFHARIDGELVSLLWRLGEPLDDPWPMAELENDSADILLATSES